MKYPATSSKISKINWPCGAKPTSNHYQRFHIFVKEKLSIWFKSTIIRIL